LKTTAALGIEVPLSLLLSVDRVIEYCYSMRRREFITLIGGTAVGCRDRPGIHMIFDGEHAKTFIPGYGCRQSCFHAFLAALTFGGSTIKI
jgi:hypothetical protein